MAAASAADTRNQHPGISRLELDSVALSEATAEATATRLSAQRGVCCVKRFGGTKGPTTPKPKTSRPGYAHSGDRHGSGAPCLALPGTVF